MKFSVIIPSFNDVDYAIKAIDSVISQTYTLLEIIFVDDGSTDGCFEKIAGRYADDNRIRCFRTENCGISSARNFGLDRSTGDYVVYLDADDLISPEFLAVARNQLKTAWDREMIVVMPFAYFPMDESARAKWVINFRPPLLGRSLRCNRFKLATTNCFPTSSLVIPRRLLGSAIRFDESVRHYEDWDLWIRIANAGISFVYAPYLIRAATLIRLRKGASSNLTKMMMMRSVIFRKNFTGKAVMFFQVPLIGEVIRRCFVLYWKLFFKFRGHPNVTDKLNRNSSLAD